MSPEQLQLKNQILGEPPWKLASELVLERIPFVFDENWPDFRSWRSDLGKMLEVDPCDIILTGSAAVGHSLNPYKSLRAFDELSDIDVAVISPYHFDVAWRTLRSRKQTEVSSQIWDSIVSHRKNYVFEGCIACDQVLTILPFAVQWLEAFSRMKNVAPTEERIIRARIYRDFSSLRSYQARGLESLRAGLMS